MNRDIEMEGLERKLFSYYSDLMIGCKSSEFDSSWV